MITKCNDIPAHPQSSQTIYRASCGVVAEHIKLILSLHEIRAAVIHRDPLELGFAMCEILVAMRDWNKAHIALYDSLRKEHNPDWHCPFCGEPVPGNFELCWNCGELHPSIASENHTRARVLVDHEVM